MRSLMRPSSAGWPRASVMTGTTPSGHSSRAEAQPARLGRQAEVLREEARVDQRRGPPQQVAVGLVALVDLAVAVVAVHVGADGEQQRRRGALAVVQLQQLAAPRLLARGDDAV